MSKTDQAVMSESTTASDMDFVNPQDPFGNEGAQGSEGSWATLTQSLAAGLERMVADQYLILDVARPPDESAESPQYYVQFACGGNEGFRAEAVSNRHLADRWKLTEKGAETLFRLGWGAPDRDGGSVNYCRSWPSPSPVAEIAQLAVTTLRRVYEVRSMDQLQYRYFDKGGSELELGDLGLQREAAVKDPDQAALEQLRPLVEDALRQALGVNELKYSADGDIPIRFGSAAVIVRLLSGPPRVRIFSRMLWDLSTTQGLLEALNDLNLRAEAGRVFWTGEEVVAAIDLPAPGLTGEHVALACYQIGSLADHFDEELAGRFGGRTTFAEMATKVGAPSDRNRDVPGYL
jgi:hypothetical protein